MKKKNLILKIYFCEWINLWSTYLKILIMTLDSKLKAWKLTVAYFQKLLYLTSYIWWPGQYNRSFVFSNISWDLCEFPRALPCSLKEMPHESSGHRRRQQGSQRPGSHWWVGSTQRPGFSYSLRWPCQPWHLAQQKYRVHVLLDIWHGWWIVCYKYRIHKC